MPGIVKYARLVNLGNYENERVEFEDYVRPDETPDEAYARVRLWVHEQLAREDPLKDLHSQLSRLRNEVFDAEDQLKQINRRVERAIERHTQLRQLLTIHGVDIEPLPAHLVPRTSEAEPEDGSGL